ncbi:MAG TPA: DUF4129 domain-containing protein [Candidatus Udaeobacter sp.]|nr:DUF4129 domain-containing protein [Candidatus Udaeobacter sp.]
MSAAAVSHLNQIPPPDTIRNVTREVLSRPDFSGPSSWEQIVITLLKALAEWLDGLASWSIEHPYLARTLAAVLVLAAVGCLAHLLYLTLGDRLMFGPSKDADPTRRPRWEILQGTAKTWREALEVARRMINEGDGRRAVWIAHRALLGLLDEQGAIRFDGWKTNSHYLRECARNHPWYSTFAELTEMYEQSIYGHRTALLSSVESLVVRVDQFCKEHAA